mmetsp:Transcript_8222/g.15483  ORF Transcript_8222/g.15483 Transcript_8222/m.15483 type:complete len:249 (-) Transcript_8222:270-1016(-)
MVKVSDLLLSRSHLSSCLLLSSLSVYSIAITSISSHKICFRSLSYRSNSSSVKNNFFFSSSVRRGHSFIDEIGGYSKLTTLLFFFCFVLSFAFCSGVSLHTCSDGSPVSVLESCTEKSKDDLTGAKSVFIVFTVPTVVKVPFVSHEFIRLYSCTSFISCSSNVSKVVMAKRSSVPLYFVLSVVLIIISSMQYCTADPMLPTKFKAALHAKDKGSPCVALGFNVLFLCTIHRFSLQDVDSKACFTLACS